MELKEIAWQGEDWIDMAHETDKWQALVSTVMNMRLPLMTENCLTIRGTI